MPRLNRINRRGIWVRNKQVNIYLQLGTQTIAHWARPERGVEGKGPGLILLNGQRVAIRAGGLLRVRVGELIPIHELDGDQSIGQAQGRFHRIR